MGVPDFWFLILFIFATQAGYLTPPYVQGIYLLKPLAPKEIETKTLYRGVIPFIILQCITMMLLWFGPCSHHLVTVNNAAVATSTEGQNTGK